MPNLVVIIHDDKVRKQTEQFLQELDIDDLRFATFKDHQAFLDLYCRDRSQDPDPPDVETAEDDGDDLKLFSDVHLMIFALDSIEGKPGPWMERIKADFKKYKHWPASDMRMALLKYEDDGIEKADLTHPLLDDIIFLPMDRLIFLQKVEIFLGLPSVIKPAFLFNQEVKMEIEISKVAKLDRLSDVALAIRNPISLRKGLPGHFYLQLDGEKDTLEIWGKVLRSEPHPDHPGQYLVYFSYFGLSKADLSRIRQSLSKSSRYQSLYNDDPTVFRFRPNDLFLSAADMRIFSGAIIDPDQHVAEKIADQLTKDMDRLKLITESSYQLFLHRYLGDPPPPSERVPPRPTDATSFFANPLHIVVTAEGAKVTQVNPQPKVGDLLLGHPAVDLFSTPEKWLNIIKDKGSHLLIEESIQFAARGRNMEKLLVLQDGDDNRSAVRAKFSRGVNEGTVKIALGPASMTDINAILVSEETNKELEFLILDTAYVPDDPAAWILGLRNRALQLKLIREPSQLKFFLTTDGDQKIPQGLINNPDILGLLIKPADGRQLIFLLSEYLPNQNTLFQFQNVGWAHPTNPVHVSKGVTLETLSEYGAMIKSKQPLVAGTMIYLRKSIFDNAPERHLAARVYACVPHATDKEYFHVYTTYFGITDAFLKFARTWIRENYANQKSGG